MIFKVSDNALQALDASHFEIKEMKLEELIFNTCSDFTRIDQSFNSIGIFGENILLLKKEVHTQNNKRADIVGIDESGNGVIIELKKEDGYLGVEMQALQYLAEFKSYVGEDFLNKFCMNDDTKDSVKSFLNGNEDLISGINQNSRIILIAKNFDPALKSMGKWLESNRVGFKEINYEPIQLNGTRVISFSVEFDAAPSAYYPLTFERRTQKPQYFWFNIGTQNQAHWETMIDKSEIAVGFEGLKGDKGDLLFQSLIRGDKIIAYCSKHGAVGYAEIENTNTQKLIPKGSAEDYYDGGLLHRLNVKWLKYIPSLKQAISPNKIRMLGGYTPYKTKSGMELAFAKQLMILIDEVSHK